MPEGNWIWKPTEDWISQTNVYRLMTRLGLRTGEAFLSFSREKPEEFWHELAREIGIDWFQPYERVLDASRGPAWCRWFVNGKLNVAWNCLDRHARGPRAESLAIVSENEAGQVRSLTYAELYELVNRLANGLKALGLVKGDRVAMCMPMVPEVVVILYACLKLGLIVIPIFSGFGPGAIATRLQDSGARVVFTMEEVQRRGKKLPLREKVEEACGKCPSIERVIVWPGGELLSNPAEVDSLAMDAEDYSLILYTSGTTGKPKGAVHTHAGCLIQTAKEIYLAFDHREGDRFFWLSDIGWMMGPWELIGNHNFGGTVFLYDGAPDFPAPDRLWRMLERHRINSFGISPTAVRVLMKYGADLPKQSDLSSLRLLGSTGEPWDDTSYLWFFENVGLGRLPIINICGGTELIGSLLNVLPIQPIKPCSLGGPSPGIATEVVDEAGNPVRGRTGYLVCMKPAPSMTRGVWGDPQRYLDTYWSRWEGWWNHGDWASVDEDGCWFVHGRADESMNVSGRKVGPAEVEEALIEHPLVSEAAVIGVPDDVKGEAIVAFIVPRLGAEVSGESALDIAAHVVRTLGPTFRPREVRPVSELPKTQSGKVVRRLIRQSYLEQPLGDLSTVANPDALGSFVQSSDKASA